MGVLAVFYALFYVWILFILTSLHPTSVKADGFAYQMEPKPAFDPPVAVAFIGLLLGPVLGAALGYFRLYFRVEGRTQRYRIGLIAVTLLTWFSSSALAAALNVSGRAWWSLLSSLLGLAAAFSIYFAYQPPRYVRRRFGIAAFGEEARA
jgi:hypothetical protein